MRKRLFAFVLLVVISPAIFAGITAKSFCDLYISDDTDGIVFPNVAVYAQVVAPAEVVRMFFAFCTDDETKKITLIMGEQAAFFTNNDLISFPGYGIYIPDFATVLFDTSTTKRIQDRSFHEIILKHRNGAWEHLHLSYEGDRDGESFNQIRFERSLWIPNTVMRVNILEPYVYAKDTKAGVAGTAVLELDDSVIAVSVSYTKSLQKVDRRTWRDIISYMHENQFKLPRASRRH